MTERRWPGHSLTVLPEGFPIPQRHARIPGAGLEQGDNTSCLSSDGAWDGSCHCPAEPAEPRPAACRSTGARGARCPAPCRGSLRTGEAWGRRAGSCPSSSPLRPPWAPWLCRCSHFGIPPPHPGLAGIWHSRDPAERAVAAKCVLIPEPITERPKPSRLLMYVLKDPKC